MGIGAAVATAIASIGSFFTEIGGAIAGGLGLDAGIGAAIGGGLEGAAIGGLGGAAIDAITGKPILPGIVEGALTGGAIGGVGPAIGAATGLGTTAGDVLAGAGAGAAGSAIEGANPLLGALEGGGSGLLAGAFSPSSIGTTDTGTVQGPTETGATLDSAPSTAPGITTTAPASETTAAALGGGSAASPGAGVQAFTPPTQSLAATLDPTSALAQAQGGSLFTGATDSAAASDAAGPIDTSLVLDPTTGGAPPAPPGLGGATDPTTGQTIPVPAGASTGGTYNPITGAPSVGTAVSDFASPVTSVIGNAGSLISSPTGKLLSTGIAGAGLLNSLIQARDPNPIPGEAQLAALATQLGNTGAGLVSANAPQAESVASQATGQAATLENYLNTGTLPPAVQDALNTATQSAITNIKAQYAARGMPPGSSAEQQDIESVQQNAIIQGGSLAASLYSQGVSLDQLAGQIYSGLVSSGTGAAQAGVGAQESVVSTNTAVNTGLNNAIANLASALGGGAKAIVNGNTISIPTT